MSLSSVTDTYRATLVAPQYDGSGNDRVRLPGEAASTRRAKALADGLELFRTILSNLEEFAVGLGIWMPFPIT